MICVCVFLSKQPLALAESTSWATHCLMGQRFMASTNHWDKKLLSWSVLWVCWQPLQMQQAWVKRCTSTVTHRKLWMVSPQNTILQWKKIGTVQSNDTKVHLETRLDLCFLLRHPPTHTPTHPPNNPKNHIKPPKYSLRTLNFRFKNLFLAAQGWPTSTLSASSGFS